MQFNPFDRWSCVLLCAAGLTCHAAEPAPPDTNSTLRVYVVNKKVSAFPANENMSTPEAAYAAWNRACASEGAAGGRRLSARLLAERMSPVPAKPLPEKQAGELLNSEVLEVRVHADRHAAVIAKVPHVWKTVIDLRFFERDGERWLNTGQDIWNSVESARTKFSKFCAHREAERALSSRPAITNPAQHLRPFVEFLKREAMDPQAFVLQALENHRVVVLGEVHNRAPYWAFNESLVRAPEFVRRAGVIYLEFPFSDQALIDRFLAAPEYDPEPVIEMLRNMFDLGWPDQPTLDFCKAVWEVNQSLPKEKRLRIVLVDMARPWKEIQKRDDWRKYDVDRDELMAANIAADLRKHAADPRHALFIVGYAHAMVNLASASGEPVKTAGWHLREKLGETNVFAVFPHSPVIANRGGVNGRIGLGLFETAFAALTNRAMAFPLDRGPFGAEMFDASMDHPTTDTFRSGFHAYLYLGPLEDEIFSPLIPGFYTDAYAMEVDRRCELMFGKSAVEVYRLSGLSGENLARMRGQWWGQPRRDWTAQRLGPVNAWELGSDWEKKRVEAKRRDWPGETKVIRQTALRLFEAIQQVDYDNPGAWELFPAPDVQYQVRTDVPAWMNWICDRFRTNPIVSVDLGELTRQTNGWPGASYKLALKDGAKLEGVLPLKWDARTQQWYGVEGVDWHLQKTPARKASK